MHHFDNDNGLSFISVCSGIEAASVAWNPLGWKAVAVGEIDAAASRLLAYHYPDVPNLGDFTKIDVKQLPRVDILCGGTPCQAFSIAGARMSLDDARGNLSLAFVGLAHELADNNGLRNVVWENVLGVLSTKDNAFGCFLAGLVGADGPFVPVERQPVAGKSTRWWRWSEKEKCHAVCWPEYGMVIGPKGRAAWAVKDAQFFGLAQRRERVLVVADFGNGADPSAVLFERVSVPWNPPTRGEKREDVAGTISARTSGGGGLGTDFELGGGLVEYAPEIARCVATREGSSQDFESTTMVAQVYSMMPQNSGKDFKARPVDVAQPLMAAGPSHGNQGGDVVCVTVPVTHTLTTEGADASEDGTGRGTPIIAQAFREGFNGEVGWTERDGDVAAALTCGGGKPGQSYPAICFTAKDYGGVAAVDIAPTLRAGTHNTSHQNGGVTPAVTITSAVRRLTPRECERLQGFPDDYTRIPVKWYATKKVTKNRPEDMWEADPVEGWWLMQADGPRYKQLGNSWAVPKFRWLGERIQRLMPAYRTAANDNTQAKKAAA